MTTAERIFARGWDSMKLYFMIGLPTEEESDVREIVKVGARARDVGKRVRKDQGAGPPKVTVSVSTHVPKPHTPFQWCAMDDRATVVKKQDWLREEARQSYVTLRTHDSDGSWLEGVIARGDRAIGDVIETAYRNGARFDSWDERHDPAAWQAAFEAHGVDPERYLATLPVTARLPWDHIDVGLEDGFLLREYRKSPARLLLWSSLSFAGWAINNALVFADLILLANVADLSLVRACTSLVAVSLLLYGLVWDAT